MEAEAYLVQEYESIILTMRHQISLLKDKLATFSHPRGRHSLPIPPSDSLQRHLSTDSNSHSMKKPFVPHHPKASTIRSSGCHQPAGRTIIHDLRGRLVTEEIAEVTVEESLPTKEDGKLGESALLQARVAALERENQSLKEKVAQLEREKRDKPRPQVEELQKQLKDKDRAIAHLLSAKDPPTPSKPALWDDLRTDLSKPVRQSSVARKVTSAKRAMSQSNVRRSVGEGSREAELLDSIKEELGAARKQVMEIVTRETVGERRDGARGKRGRK